MNFTIKTVGCKTNTYESNKIRDELISKGFNYIDVNEKENYSSLDFYIVNTCSVTNIADKKSRQMLHLAKKYNPNVIVIAIGCLVDSLSVGADTIRPNVGANETVGTDTIRPNVGTNETVGADTIRPSIGANETVGASYASPLTGVDYILSNKEKNNLSTLITTIIAETTDHKVRSNTVVANENVGADIKSVGADTIRPNVGVSYASPINNTSRVRAFIKIQDGCNQYCSYCIIPYLRGNITSRDDDEIIDEIKEKAKNGVKEIVLTGIHLSSFGLDRVNINYENEGAIDIAREALLNIMNRVSEIDGVERIRLGSLEPRIINDHFLEFIVGIDSNVGARTSRQCRGEHCEPATVGASYTSPLKNKFCANFCLSLQSGSDKTLKKMNRHYTTKDFENACDLIRKYLPNATITTDIIVGFPGETEEDFEESLSFAKKMRFYNPNIFPYSRRKGTVADKMEGQLTNEEKHKRSKIMIEECEKITKEIENEYNKKNHDILVEEIIEENGKKFAVGYTKEYVKLRRQYE